MPLSTGTSDQALSSNIAELMKSYKSGGQFARTKTPTKARQMAVAAAFSMRKKSKGRFRVKAS